MVIVDNLMYKTLNLCQMVIENLNSLQKFLILNILSQGWQAFDSCSQISKIKFFVG